jgi:two-component system, chemotaxis family, protein-glutamate methylesterase/glutaminase
MIRILIVDDVRVVREKLMLEFTKFPDLEVVGAANTGRAGIELALSKKPDVVLMDLHMPDVDGFTATRTIMEQCPMPVIILSAKNEKEVSKQAFDSGAVEFVSKETPISRLVEVIRTMAKVRVVGFHVQTRPPRIVSKASRGGRPAPPLGPNSPRGLVLIGASTGGPQALQLFFSSLAPDLPIAYAVVQHIAHGFMGSLLEWLSSSSVPKLRIAQQGDALEMGNAYVAPDDAHLHVVRNGHLALSDAPLRNGVRPSADELFESAAKWERRRRFALLFTGMGTDGAEGLLALRAAGAMTVTQEEKSCVIYGMPAAAVALGASQATADPVGAAALVSAWGKDLRLTA